MDTALLNVFSINTVMSFIESLLRIFTYIALITFLYKGLKALNVYIDKNSKRE